GTQDVHETGTIGSTLGTKDQGLRTNPPGPAFGLLLEAFEPPCFVAAQTFFFVGSLGLASIGRTGSRLEGLPASGQSLQESQQALGAGGHRGLEQVRPD